MSAVPSGELLRALTPEVVAALARRYGDFETCEDAVQEALLAAATQWPSDGVPENPKAWLITVAARRRIELWRSDDARRRREETVAALEPPDPAPAPQSDDTLTLMLLCCHPALTRPSQVALTLRAVGGLTTTEIARAFLVPEPTVGQRISRAKQRIAAAGGRFRMPPPAELDDRVAAVCAVLYLVFNEGHTASEGPDLQRVELSGEAVRLARLLRAARPADDEVAGLLALMLLTDARRDARVGPDGGLVPLAEQDRSRWDAGAIDEGLALVAQVLPAGPVGPYQLQAAIAAVHAEAASASDTDWPQILGLYRLLETVAPGPMVALNRVVAVAMVHGPAAGLAGLDELAADAALAGHHRLHAVRAHLLERAGRVAAARREYTAAADLTRSAPERRYLAGRAAALRG
ncbi:putative RNA polymerase, sigma-24 subunit, ECF subfamily [Pseudonocardia dioxanivorans CB1190]|uniref:RNA polymerase, sigma-24 subunit, ECF subfamily n=1 Tax=Pseudonocardia dioxanivorans (strain ATCC 55486 / DSM 44775 / JCM 13855 / CB1190) TaxID=675635 RepID=F4CLA2_PSEUX|nr:sigma-70 family RNA polymerase sigma factor [Pseudonocardia dioxanivorans]AEA25944.1 putative RNA polymerase, sigma-24 subunit, ECF subfamily [Pseudonocardia dioxanivorans CB1190]